MNILIIEDGFEYLELMRRFLGDRYNFTRVEHFRSAVQRLEAFEVDLIYLDLNFERLDTEHLVGDWEALQTRFNGDSMKSQRFVARNQGLYILDALRREGHSVPVLISHDFSREKGRWSRIEARHKPIAYVSDNAGPNEIAAMFEKWRETLVR